MSNACAFLSRLVLSSDGAFQIYDLCLPFMLDLNNWAGDLSPVGSSGY